MMSASDGSEGAWLGIDLGTSNCACAVWDSTRGRPKVLQLNHIAKPRKGKVGRIVPSCVLVGRGDAKVNDDNNSLPATVGFPALQELEQGEGACVTSTKRLVGTTNLKEADQQFIKSLPFDVYEQDDGSLSLLVTPAGSTKPIQISPAAILTTILASMRLAAEQYLIKQTPKKDLKVPGSSTRVTNCVVGVPAHFGQSQRKLLEQACRDAGFSGHVSTITESTAASMAYGLFVSVPTEKHVLVLDMGGGTTDVTIAKLSPNEEFSVVATDGDWRLGGDDMDEALLQLVKSEMSRLERRKLLIAFRKCKEALCGTEEDKPVESYEVDLGNGKALTITRAIFDKAIAPLVKRVEQLVKKVVSRSGLSIDEVVLVGGATRVPAVQDMLRKAFPSIPDLCSSVSAEEAVAQGAAIQAAIKSGLVPISELKSAMMLDALPHPIGVLMPGQESYVPILAKDAPLPVMGYASFTLADVHQKGVTVVAVEDVGDSLERIGEFTFLLHRLSDDKVKKLDGARSVDIGMTMKPSGEFVVSIFDENDPELLRKKQRYQKQKGGEIGYEEEIRDEPWSWPLLIACFVLFCLYVAVKLVFHEPEQENSSISEGSV